MAKECDVLQVEQLQEVTEAIDVVLKCVERAVGGFLRKATAEVVDGDDAKTVFEGRDEPSPGEAPRGITMDHQERWSGAFVDVMLDTIGRLEPL